MSFVLAAQRVQALYERGAITYPRTTSRAMTPAVATACEAAAIRWAPLPLRARPAAVAADGAHGAVVPTLDAIATANLRVPEWMLAPDDAILHRFVRHAARCVAPVTVDRPDLSAQPEWARALAWSRPTDDTPVHLLHADERDPIVGVTLYDAEEVAFRALLAAELGRPSSIIAHAVHAVERGAVGPRGLTDQGHDILARSPAALDGQAAREVAQRCETGGPEADADAPDALHERVRYASEALGELAPLLDKARRKPAPQPRVDAPVEDAGARLREHASALNEANRRAVDSLRTWLDSNDEFEPGAEESVPYAVVGMQPRM